MGCSNAGSGGTSNSTHQTPGVRTTAPAGPSRCDLMTADYQSRHGVIEEPMQSILIERIFQRVIRQDCKGRTVSDKIETVRSPTLEVTLHPTTLPAPAAAVDVFNPLTCNSMGSTLPVADVPFFGLLYAITGDSNGTIALKTDLANAWLTFQLKQGPNKIYYTYYRDCLPINSLRNMAVGNLCAKAEELQTGAFNLDVKYAERTLQDTLTVMTSTCN